MITINLDDELEALLSNMAARAHTQPEQFVKDLIKHHAETLVTTEPDFFGYAGLWQDRNIDQETLRADAWLKNQP